ncbi:MAG TPA: hypothetical protein VL588_02055, partial [Bdellovibrionota bacterium]|nr:hypothetical protein [Bdellovibrionota bacterium]
MAARTLATASTAFVLALILGGCMRDSQRSAPGVLARWEKAKGLPEGDGIVGRSLAEEAPTGPPCLKDRGGVDQVKADVAALERQQGGAAVEGEWHGLDLSKLSHAGATFLKTYGNVQYAGNDLRVSDCAGIPCVINRTYGQDDDALEGWITYYWYLKMGTALATDNRIPEQKSDAAGTYLDVVHDHKDYLFKPSEVAAFWALSKTLSDQFHVTKRNKVLHRIPHGSCLEGQSCHECLLEDPKWGCMATSTTCGLASWDAWLLLTDECLETGKGDDANKLFGGTQFLGPPHEMAHHIDYMLGATDYSNYSGHAAEFMDVSGWYLKEITDPDTGSTVRQWDVHEGKEGFVNDYSGSSPAEDFAETTAWVRYRGNEALAKTPLKNALLGQKLFGGRTFDDAGLAKAYRSIGAAGMGGDPLTDMVKKCAEDPSTGASGAADGSDSRLPDLGVPLQPSLRACLSRGYIGLENRAVADLKRTEMEACDFLTPVRETTLKAGWLDDLKSKMVDLLSHQQTLAEFASATKDLENRLARHVDAREAYVNCFRSRDPDGNPDVEACYDRAMGAGFDRVAAEKPSATLDAEALQELRARWLAERPVAPAQSRATQLYQAMFAGLADALADRVQARWDACLVAPAGTLDAAGGVLLTRPFSSADQYIASQVLNCINGAAESDMDAARDEFTGSLFRIDQAEAKAFVRELILGPAWTAILQGLAARAADREAQQIHDSSAAMVQSLVARLKANLSW